MLVKVRAVRGWLGSATARHVLLAIACLLSMVVIFRCAWITEDAYITLRTVDNFIRGYGLTWNVGERVQSYTHPLWMLLISAGYFFTHEPFYTTLFLSLAISSATLILFAWKVAGSTAAGLLGVAILTVSKAFVDYSTSGLENPLTHLLLILFTIVYLTQPASLRRFFWLSLVAGLAAVNRMDTLLLYLPALALAAWELRRWKAASALAAGLLPFILWECFSVLYYGFPFPNTAYAKLNISYNQLELPLQGLDYLLNSIRLDPVTLLATLTGISLPILTRKARSAPLALGAALYLLYVIRVGGDFMSGRFLTAPLLAGVALLAASEHLSATRKWLPVAALPAIIGLGFLSPYPTLISGDNYGWNTRYVTVRLLDEHGISDERGIYYPGAGLLPALEGRRCNCPADIAAAQVLAATLRANNPPISVEAAVGILGYYSGPSVHIIDIMGLADPLLARLPPRIDATLRIGHLERTLPGGYVRTIITGRNVISDRDLAVYYAKLSSITQGNLFDPSRLADIWKMNTGQYDSLLRTRLRLFQQARRLNLVRWDAPSSLTPGQPLTLTLYWQAQQTQPYPYFAYTYLTDEFGTLIKLEDRQQPLPFDGSPTEILADKHQLPMPDKAPALYTLHVGIYGSGLDYHNGIPYLSLGTVKTPPPQVSLPPDFKTIDARLGSDIVLMGYSASQHNQPITLSEAAPGPLRLTLYWQALARPAAAYHIFIHGQDAAGNLVIQADTAPLDGDYPTTAWDAGEVIVTPYTLDIPAGEGPLNFHVGLYGWPSLERLPAIQGGQRVADDRIALPSQ